MLERGRDLTHSAFWRALFELYIYLSCPTACVRFITFSIIVCAIAGSTEEVSVFS